jgi:hypothetical protein
VCANLLPLVAALPCATLSHTPSGLTLRDAPQPRHATPMGKEFGSPPAVATAAMAFGGHWLSVVAVLDSSRIF